MGGKVTCLGDLRAGSYLVPAGIQWSSNHRPSVEMVVKVLGSKVVVISVHVRWYMVSVFRTQLYYLTDKSSSLH